jgi:hypothetical protein
VGGGGVTDVWRRLAEDVVRVTDYTRATKVLWKLYPYDAFIRRVGNAWSAEVVEPGQTSPPYRTLIITEASTLPALTALLEQEREARR